MRDRAHFRLGQPVADRFHVVADLLDDFRERDGRAFFQQQGQAAICLSGHLALIERQFVGTNVEVASALFLGGLIESLGGLVDLDFFFQHLAEAAFEQGQDPFHFLFAQLSQDFLEFGDGLLQFLERFGLFLQRLGTLGFLEVLLRFAHFLFGFADAFLGR